MFSHFSEKSSSVGYDELKRSNSMSSPYDVVKQKVHEHASLVIQGRSLLALRPWNKGVGRNVAAELAQCLGPNVRLSEKFHSK